MDYIKTLSARNRGVRTGKVEFIVLHDTAGSGTEADAHYLANDPEHRSISVDFVALKDGRVFQLNQDLSGHCTYHAGRNTSFMGFHNGAVNQHSVGIEISQKANISGLNPLYPPEQVQAVAATCADLMGRFGLTKDRITTHQHIITDGSRTDPRSFPWDDFWRELHPALVGNQDVPTATLSALTYEVKTGDSLYAISNTFHVPVEEIKALNNLNDPSNVIRPGQSLLIRR